MPRIPPDRIELTQKFFLAIIRAFARHSSAPADLLNPGHTETAERRRRDAAMRLAEFLTEQFFNSKHEVTREGANGEAEDILRRLRETSAQRQRRGGGPD